MFERVNRVAPGLRPEVRALGEAATLRLASVARPGRRRAASRLVASAMAVSAFFEIDVSRARACSCMAVSFEDQLERASVVFEGRVEADRVEGMRRIVRFRVTQAWRGVSSEVVEVHTARDSAACGFNFVFGEHYLVYATGSTGAPEVSLCSRTARMDDADEDRRRLGSGTVPVDVVDETAPPPRRARPATRAGCSSCAAHRGPGGDGLVPLLGGLVRLLAWRSGRPRSPRPGPTRRSKNGRWPGDGGRWTLAGPRPGACFEGTRAP